MRADTKRSFIAGIVVGLLAGLAAGWAAAAYVRGHAAERLESVEAEHEARVADLRSELTFAQLHLQLGEVMLQAHRNNFGDAQRQAGSLFQQLGEFSRTTGNTELAQRAKSLSERQGEILGDLSALSPVAAEKLGDAYLAWRPAGE